MFEDLEARLNRLTMERLANATAVIPGIDEPVRVIFDAEYKEQMVGMGMGSSAPQMVIANARVPADFLDMNITVDGAAWKVADCQSGGELPDGLSKVVLEKA
jgi:hypothetical protein